MQELSLFNLEKRKMREDLINEYKYLKDICQEYGIKLFLVVPSDRMRNTDYKVKQEILPQHEEELIYIEEEEHWNRLLREVMESSFLEIHKTNLDTFLCNLLKVTLSWHMGWTRLSQELPSNPN